MFWRSGSGRLCARIPPHKIYSWNLGTTAIGRIFFAQFSLGKDLKNEGAVIYIYDSPNLASLIS